MFTFKPNTIVGYVASNKEGILTYLRSLFVKDNILRDAKLGRVHTFQTTFCWECRIYEIDEYGDDQEDFREHTLHGQGYDELFIEPFAATLMDEETLKELAARVNKPKEEDREDFVTIELTMSQEEWMETANSLTSKMVNLEKGAYGASDEDLDIDEWVNTLQRAYVKIGMALDEKGVAY